MVVLKNKNGFTLAEIMVALIVMGIMAFMALPRMMTFMDRVKSQEATQALTLIYGEQLGHEKDTGSYASSLGALDVTFNSLKNFKTLVVDNSSSTVTGSLSTAKAYLASLTALDDSYVLYVLLDGTIVCTPDGASTKCNRMGFPLF